MKKETPGLTDQPRRCLMDNVRWKTKGAEMETMETELEQEFERAEDKHCRYDVLDLTKPEGDPEREVNGLSPSDFVSRYEDTDTLDPDEESAIWDLNVIEKTQVNGTSMEVTRVE